MQNSYTDIIHVGSEGDAIGSASDEREVAGAHVLVEVRPMMLEI